MKTRFHSLFIGILLVCTEAKATYQVNDVIDYMGNSYCFGLYGDTPLEHYFTQNKQSRPAEFCYRSSDCRRGHIASWRVVDNKLWLVQILIFNKESDDDGFRSIDFLKLPSHNFPLRKLFPQASTAVFANWFTGKISLNEHIQIDRPQYELNFTNGVCVNGVGINGKPHRKITEHPLTPLCFTNDPPARINVAVTTNQVPDLLEYERVTYIFGKTGTTPLTDYYKSHPQPDEFRYSTQNGLRGHIASWRIADGKLWLVQLFLCGGTEENYVSLPFLMLNRRLPLESLFPKPGIAVWADWFTGTIDIDGYSCATVDEQNAKRRKTFEVVKGVVTNLEHPESHCEDDKSILKKPDNGIGK